MNTTDEREIRVDETVLTVLIKPREAAAMLSCHPKTLRKLQRAHSDVVRRYKIGSGPHGLRYALAEIEELRWRLVETKQ